MTPAIDMQPGIVTPSGVRVGRERCDGAWWERHRGVRVDFRVDAALAARARREYQREQARKAIDRLMRDLRAPQGAEGERCED